jgi:thiol-disulfide isomerase/thioredoxin
MIKRLALFALLSATLMLMAQAQAMMAQAANPGGGTGSMMAAPAQQGGTGAMMAPPARQANTGAMMAPPARAGSSGLMMSGPRSYEELRKSGTLADLAVGASLRLAPGRGNKVQFRSLAAAQALARKGPVVLFFAADWCPSCQADLRDLNASGERLGKATVVVVDYDKAGALLGAYGITYQDSYVQIDAAGRALSVWNGGGVEALLAHLAPGS